MRELRPLQFFVVKVLFVSLVRAESRPQIQSIDGNLVLRASGGKDVSIFTLWGGRFLVNNQDVSHLIKSAAVSSDTVNQCKADSKNALEQVEKISQTLNGNQGIVQRLSAVEGIANTTVPPSRILFLGILRRKVNTLQRKLRVLINLLSVDDCIPNPCANGGTCQDMYNAFVCHCTDNWEGSTCTVDVNECTKFIGTELGCQNGATCLNKPGSYECSCADGWFGLHCTKRSQDCSSGSKAVCGYGTCVPETTGVGIKCICDQGWTTDGSKPACMVDVNECELYHPPCSTNPPVKCVNLPGTFYCGHCPNGYTGNGFFCSDIDECSVFNGGCSVNPMVQCINTPGSRICGMCPAGYIGNGVTCTFQGSVCSVNNGGCHSAAQCRDNSRISSTYVECICPTGYSGNGVGSTGCTLGGGSDACASSPCVHGTCETKANGDYMCHCRRRYTGANCNIRKNPCDSNPCQNGGQCVNALFSFLCNCTASYYGSLCEHEKEVCGRVSGETGSIKHPPSTRTLSSNEKNCAWIIEVPMDKVINITFSSFSVPRCIRNWLQINDGSNTAANLIGRFCGNKYPKGNKIISSSHNLYLWYRSDGSAPLASFELSWTVAEPVCGGDYNATSHGSFHSPGAPGYYPANRDCYYRFTAPFGKRIQFHFFSMMIGTNKNCSQDYLEFHQGLEVTDPVFAKFCTTTHPEPLFSPGNEVLAYFHSDARGSFPGFQISYSVVAGIPGCGGVYTRDVGEITSPASNGKYSSDSLCEYKIKLPVTSKIKLTFKSFNLELSRNCEFDYVAIYDGPSVDSPLVGRFCGETSPAPIISLGSNMLIVFRSDWSSEGRGFNLKYETVCGGKYMDESGSIESPNYPNVERTEGYKECTYHIVQPVGNNIVLNVTDLDFGNNTNCRKGHLEIHDGDTENSTLIGTYCEKPPDVIISTFNYLWIKYVARYGVYKGFHLDYKTVNSSGCGGILKAKMGSVESPPDLNSYTKGLTCTWLVIAPDDHVIQITWVKFYLEENYECTYDNVKLFDNGTSPGSLIGTYCGNKMPPTILSSSNKVSISLKLDNSNNLDGFLLTYHFIHERNVCGGKYFTTSGVVKTPHFPDDYPYNRDCVWVITVPPGQQIMLNVTFFEIEQYFGCRYDFLEIRNGGTSASPLIGRYCGKTIPNPIPSHANQLYLHFKSDMTKNAPGFKILWSSTSTGCGGTLTSPVGTIISPHYPEPYSRNTECYWKISVSAGSRIQIVFADLDLEAHMGCVLDYVELLDGVGYYAESLGKFCTTSSNLPSTITSTKNHITVKFRSDLSYQGRGFQLNYATMCNNQLVGFGGVIESPNFPSQYPHDQNCLWVIGVPPGNKINITFSHFDMERSLSYVPSNCSTDYLEVRYRQIDEDESERMVTAGRYCVERPPTDLTINSNTTEIKYSTSALYSSKILPRFRLEWNIVGCGGLLTHPTGSIETPNYPSAYPANTQCDWLIQTDSGASINITFQNIDLEKNSDCTFDYIELYNGINDSFPLISKICHVGIKPIEITSTGNSLFVRFQSDLSYRGRGFRAEYTSVPSKCGGKMSSSSGVIHSPNYPKNFDKNDTCDWLIEVEENHVVLLKFEDLDLLNSCTKSYLKVYDGPTQAYPLLKTLCGSKAPNETIASTSNFLFLEMVTNPYITTKGFLAKYTKGCGARIKTQSSGLITFNDATTTSTMIIECAWTIESERPDEHVFLTLTHIDAYCGYPMEDSGLVIYDGADTWSPLIGRYCGSKIPQMIKSTGNMLHIYTNDINVVFSAKYSVVDTACGGSLESESGLFATPGYPSNYPVDMQCEWILTVAPGNKISVSFSEFNLTKSNDCNEDYLEIRSINATGHLFGVYCGDNNPTNIVSNNTIWLFFRSSKPEVGSEAVTAAGFNAEYTLTHGNELRGPSGQLASPMYPRYYGQYGEFTWRITVTMGSHITMKFIDFDTDYIESGGCYLASLDIYDGYDDTAPLIDTYCGITRPGPIKTTSNVVFIKASYNIVRKGSKFLLEWLEIRNPPLKPSIVKPKINGCGTNGTIAIGNEDYNLTSPGYPGPYSHVSTCTWLFSTSSDKHFSVEIEAIDLNSIVPCLYGDSLKFYSGVRGTDDFELVESLCYVNRTFPSHIVTSNLMKVVFKATAFYAAANRTGFHAVVSAVCGGNLDGPNGVVVVDNTTVIDKRDHPVMCQWNITVRSGKTIEVTFDDFYLGSDSGSCKNYVMLRNGQYPDSPMLGNGKYCGNEKPEALETTGNFLYIKYYSHSQLTTFSLKYKEVSVVCGGTIELGVNETTTITSPNYPNIPTPHTECIWLISVPGGEAVQIDFLERFDLASSENCTVESLEIRNGGTKLSPLIGKYCYDMPSTQVTLDNMMYIKYFTDTNEPKNGFKANISIASCGGVIRANEGSIKSPGFNAKKFYPSSAKCKWSIIGPKDHYLILNFDLIDLPYSMITNCTNIDHVSITEMNKINNTEVSLGDFCGKKSPLDIKSSNNEVTVYFNANMKYKLFNGFKLSFNSSQDECGGDINGESGVFTSPGYPIMDHNNRNCEWTITVPKGRRIKVELEDFDFDKSISFISQGIAFFNGGDFSSHIMYLKPGDATKVVRSSDNALKIFFWSEQSSNHRGFKAKYSSDEPTVCLGDFSQKSGVITAPNETSYKCTWVRNENNPEQTTMLEVVGNFPRSTSPTCIYGMPTIKILTERESIEICRNKNEIVRLVESKIALEASNRNSGELTNFTITYKTYACGGIRTDSLGNISSPGYPNKPTNNSECAWSIKMPDEQRILLKFKTFELGSCEKSYLKVYNGKGRRSPRIGMYCDNMKPDTIQSQGEFLYLEYHFNNDENNGGNGFSFSYEPVVKGCGGIIHSPSSIIETPFYPNDYPNNAFCLWELRAQEGYHINLEFIDRFQIESTDDCAGDYVKVYQSMAEENKKDLKRYCGRQLPPQINSTMKSMFVHFQSNGRTTGVGFRAKWKLQCGGTFNADDTKRYLVSPGYPESYANELHCKYKIAAPGKYIQVEFEDFELERGPGCFFDNVTISKKNYYYRNAKSNAYCGTNRPPRIRYFNEVNIEFITDKWIRRRGFKLSYQTDSCGGNVTAPGIIEVASKKYSSNLYYEGNNLCVWNITAPKDKRITLRFINLNLVYSLACGTQYVEVVDNTGRLAVLCGELSDEDLPIVHSNNNTMQVSYQYTSFLNKNASFQAVVYFTYGPALGCGGQINVTAANPQTIQAPHLNDFDCIWHVSAPKDYTVEISIVESKYSKCSSKNSIISKKDCSCMLYEFRDGITSGSEIIASGCDAPINGSISYYTSSKYAWIRLAGSASDGQMPTFRITAVPSICGDINLVPLEKPQYLMSPQFPNNYPKNIKCVWRLKSVYSAKISVKFVEFDLNNDLDMKTIANETCGKRDRVEIIDKNTKSFHFGYDLVSVQKPSNYLLSTFNMMLGTNTFCNKYDVGYEYHSQSDHIQMSFYSNANDKHGKGFKLQYQLASCNRNYTALQGRIFKNWHIGNCSIYVTVPENRTISLYFGTFSTFFVECSKNGLQIYDGDKTKPKLLELCQTNLPNPVFSSGNQLYINLFTLVKYAVNTFDITYTSTDKGKGCGGDFYNFKGVLSSPLYPETYNEDKECVFSIRVPSGLQVALKFSVFDIQGPCEFNYVEVHSFTESQNRVTYCKGDKPAVWVSNGHITINYKTSSSNAGMGWKASFMAITSDITAASFAAQGQLAPTVATAEDVRAMRTMHV